MLPLNHSHCLLRNMLIQQHMFDILKFSIYFLDNRTIYDKSKDDLNTK